MPINMTIEYPKLERENQELRTQNKLLLETLRWVSKVTNSPEIGIRCDKAVKQSKTLISS